MSTFFLERPVFAWVIAIAMMLGGGLAIVNLPVSQYPPIAPPSISIRAQYTGASAKTVEDSVIQIIESKMTGLDPMLYMQLRGRLLRRRGGHPHLRAGDGPRPRLVEGPEQAPARDARRCPTPSRSRASRSRSRPATSSSSSASSPRTGA